MEILLGFATTVALLLIFRRCASAQASDVVSADRFIVPDTAALLHGLKLHRPELAPVKSALDREDIAAASTAYIAHFRARPLAETDLPSWAPPDPDSACLIATAERYLAGHLDDGYNTYDVPETGIDWDGCPLSCLTRFPIFGSLCGAIRHIGKPEYIRFLVDHLLQYMDAYPIETFSGTNTVGGWINHYRVARPWYWCMIPERLTELAHALALVRTFPEVRDAELLRILHRMFEETAYLRADVGRWIDRRHNGGCSMLGALAAACEILDDFEAVEEWRAHDAHLLARYIRESFYPDGQCIEQTTAYSASIVSQVHQLAHVLRDQEGVRAVQDRLKAMAVWTAAMVRPTGYFPSFGDNYARTLSWYVHRPILGWLGAPWLESLLDNAESPHPPFTVWPLPDQAQWSGYYTMRSDWSPQARFLAVDCGPWGTTHRHGDRLSFVLSACGADFIIDPTSTRYASNEPDAFLSRQEAGYLHNTLTVDGVDEFINSPLETDVPLENTWEHADRYTLFSGSYSFAPVKAVRWERRILFVDRTWWLLQDVLTGDPEDVEVEQNFQFEMQTDVAFEDGRTITTAPNGARLVLVPLSGGQTPSLSVGDLSPHTTYWPEGRPHRTRLAEDGERPPSHGRGWTGRWGHRLLPAPAVVHRGRVRLPALLTLALVPLAPGQDLADLPQIASQLREGGTVWTLPAALQLLTTPERIEVL